MKEAPEHYAVLEASPTATPEEIRAAYLTQVARYHPDKHSGNPLQDLAAQRLVQLNEAYAVLSDPGRRAEYDARRRSNPGGAQPVTTARRQTPWPTKALMALMLVVLALPLVRVGLRLIGLAVARPVGAAAVLAVIVAAIVWARRRRRR